MRDLKFRAWDKQRKAWVRQDGNPYVFPFEGITAMTCAGNGTGHIDKKDMSDYYELSQYTGLKDKNGKEIYEGDVVKAENGEIGFIDFVNGRFLWNQCGGHWNLIYDDQYHQVPDEQVSQTDLEVIGNQYEHPELLK